MGSWFRCLVINPMTNHRATHILYSARGRVVNSFVVIQRSRHDIKARLQTVDLLDINVLKPQGKSVR